MISLLILISLPIVHAQWEWNPFQNLVQQQNSPNSIQNVATPNGNAPVNSGIPTQAQNALPQGTYQQQALPQVPQESGVAAQAPVAHGAAPVPLPQSPQPTQGVQQLQLPPQGAYVPPVQAPVDTATGSALQAKLEEVYGIEGSRTANQKLRSCCRRLKPHEADVDCRRKYCDFNSLTANTLLNYISQCSPRVRTIHHMWNCASSRADHSQCCLSKGVLPACLRFCDNRNGGPKDYMNYAFCLAQFDNIRSCFKEYLTNNPNFYGDN